MKIGNIELKNNIILAPMAGYTDAGFRMLCADYGAGLTVTEMVSAKGLAYGNRGTAELLETSDIERPVAVQLFGAEPDFMRRAVEDKRLQKFDIIDVNMGCPVRKIVNNGEGSALMKQPEKVYALVKAMADATDKPVTVKIRAGFNEGEITAPEIAKVIEEAGGAAVAVHARTREQFYSGTADWSVIAAVKKSVSIPVIGNGDVATKDDCRRMLESTGCDGVMIGRGALGRPYIFAEYADKEYEFDVKTAIWRHIERLRAYLPERTVVNQMKLQLCWYAKNVNRVKAVRASLASLKSTDDLTNIVEEYFNKQKGV